MKKIGYKAYLTIILVLVLLACQKENIPTPIDIQTPTQYSDAYYADLRAYKKTPHQVAFGWYSAGSKPTATMGLRYLGVPDSMDIISLWGGVPQDSTQLAELKFVQKVKGTKMLVAVFPPSDEELMPLGGLNPASMIKAARIHSDVVYKYGLDGLDIDWEPADLGGYRANYDAFTTYVLALSQFLGPKSGTGKILDINFAGALPPEATFPCIDYLISQSYGARSHVDLQSTYDRASGFIPPSKLIVTSEFAFHWETGGTEFTDTTGAIVPGLLGMAAWNPKQGKKAGAGAFSFKYEYNHTPSYKYMRQMIQIMNPAKR